MRRASDGVGKRLREARTQRNLTMVQLATKTKCSQSAISLMELDKRHPTAQIIEDLAVALEVDPCWLAYGTGAKPNWGTAKEKDKKEA